MHKISDKEFALEDFSHERLFNDILEPHFYSSNVKELYDYTSVLDYIVSVLNNAREQYLETKDKRYWWQMIQLLPSSYNQKRTIMLNYEVLANIYKSRKDHKLDEWRTFCSWIEELPYSEVIIGKYLDEENKDLKDIPIRNTDAEIKKVLGVISPSEHLHIWANGKRINTTPETEELGLGFKNTKDQSNKTALSQLMFIRENSTVSSQCELLAEEAVELAHVSQKVARYFRGEQPLSEEFDIKKAEENLLEEFADVLLCAHVLINAVDVDGNVSNRGRTVEKIFNEKADRWVKRISKEE